MRNQADAPWNIVSLDYMDLCPIAVHFLLALNFPVQLQVCIAAVAVDGGKSTDMTEKVQSLIKRNRVLLLNAKEDLDISQQGTTLTIAYRLGGDVYKVLTVELQVDTIVLLSHFISTADEVTTIQGNEEGKGYICQGKICSEIGDCDRTGTNSTILEYNKTGTSCNFQIVE